MELIKKIFISLFFPSILFFFPPKVFAICPVCTVAVGAGIGFSRWLGIDDIITGLWIGGLIVSMIVWTINFLNSKNIRFKGRKILTVVFYYLFILVPLQWTNIIGHPFNKFLGRDKLIFGTILGSIAFAVGALLYETSKSRNHGKAIFPFSKVVLPVSGLIILSIIFYFITKK